MKRIIATSLVALFATACNPGEGSVTNNQTVDAESTDAVTGDTDGEVGEVDAAQDAEDVADADAESDTGAPTEDVVDTASDTSSEDTEEDTRTEQDAAPAGPFVIWMAPDGDDARSGLAESEAVATLGRVEQILEQHQPQRDVEVRIGSGRYRAQTIEWTYSVPGHTIKFTRTNSQADRPVFDGCTSSTNCPGGTWFRLRRSDGSETRIEFNYIRVENYQTAISLDGNRNAEADSNGSNRIYGCYFYRIGNVFNSSLAPSTAAVRLVNSDDNVIANNHFDDIINTTSLNRLHAIYVAHMSDRNEIARNRFVNNSGDPVRVRDFSNDNSIVDNTFEKAGKWAGYTEWYCDHDARDDCTKATPECPSWGNEFRRNHLDGNYSCEDLGTFEYFQDDSTTGCSPPISTARRLRTSENTRPTTPCAG
ncbi:MAG: right-handed parallel beta-helix repeat-containing protein [Myxococcota bacterium]